MVSCWSEGMQMLALLFAIGIFFSTGNCSCEDTNDTHSDICYDILQSFQDAFIRDKGNLHRSRRAFFYAPNADPVLLRVKYNITFAENITEDVLFNCTNEDNSITLNQTYDIIRGWTSRGLYLWIQPLLLNRMQMVLPFCILRWAHKRGDVKSNPEMDSFLWDGSFNLSTLLINLHITSLPCIPSKEIFNSTVEELTKFLKVYASQEYHCVSDTLQTEDIGFALDETAVSTLPPSLQSTVIGLYLDIYDEVGSTLVIVTYALLYFTIYKTALTENKVTLMMDHDNIIYSTALTGTILILSEFIGTICRHKVDNPRLIFSVLGCTSIVYVVLFIGPCLIRLIKVGKIYHRDSLPHNLTFSQNILLLWAIQHIATYLLPVYHFALPTFLLLLVHPKKVIVFFVQLIVSIVATIIISSAYMMFSRQLYIHFKSKKNSFGMCIIISYVLISIVTVVGVFLGLLMLFPLVYALMLNQPSSITADPIYTALSLIPSATISSIIWILKAKVFQLISIEKMQNAQSTEHANEQRDMDDLNTDTEDEHLPLLTESDANSNTEPKRESNQGRGHNYGATKMEDMNSICNETNC